MAKTTDESDLINKVAKIISKKENISLEKAEILFLTSKSHEYLDILDNKKYSPEELYDYFQNEIKYGRKISSSELAEEKQNLELIQHKIRNYVRNDDYSTWGVLRLAKSDVNYIKNWKEKNRVFTNKQIFELAKIISEVENKSIYASKLEVTQIPFITFWESVIYLVGDFDAKFSFHLWYLHKLIDFGGYTRYKDEISLKIKVQQEQWEKWLNDHIIDIKSKSIDINKVLEENFPLTLKAINDAKLINKEKNEENKQLIFEFIAWLKNNQKMQLILLRWLRFSSNQWNKWKEKNDSEFNTSNKNMARIYNGLYFSLKNQNWDQFSRCLWQLDY